MTAEQVKRRIEAARVLRGMTQVEMDQAGAAQGLGRQELSRIERGALPLGAAQRRTLCDILRVPERWFTDEDVDVVVGLTPDIPGLSADEEVARRADELMRGLLEAALAHAPGAATSGQSPGAPGRPGSEAEGGQR